MFWKLFGKSDDEEKKEETQEDIIELPPLEELENWVLQLIVKLELQPGEFTFLPAYGGILLFIKQQGLSWIPYSEIKDALGEIQKNKVMENTATVGGAAAVAATGVHILPALLVHRLLKGSYRILAKPSPDKSMSFLSSMIDKVIIEETPLREGLLNTFEEVPYKSQDGTYYSTAVIKIQRKFLDQGDDNVAMRFVKGILKFFGSSNEPVFAIPPQSDVKKFASILEAQGLTVERIENEIEGELEDGDYTIEDVDHLGDVDLADRD